MSQNWMKLDNAALIFPAVRRPGWVNVFRVSVTLTEEVDPAVLQQAVIDLMPRFPSIYVHLGSGLFWYFLEKVKSPPKVRQDYAYPLTHMGTRELHTCCVRFLYYEKRIAVEFFHALTDGSGGMVFLKSLTARYLTLKYGICVNPDYKIPNICETPRSEELEDSFLRYAGQHPMSRSEENSCRLHGTPDAGFLHLITGVINSGELLEVAHSHNATVTAFVAAVMAQSIIEMQSSEVAFKRQKPVKITIPVNLRKIFPSETLRNFALTINPGVDPRLGEYSIDDLCKVFTHQMADEITPQKMAGRIAANVNPQKYPALRIAPLFIKNMALRIVYASVGESKGCLNISNLGCVLFPKEIMQYINRLEFIIGVQFTYPNNCSIVTCGDVTCINMIRNIRESDLEQRFFSKLVELGVPVSIESN